jgi:uncharacterized protein
VTGAGGEAPPPSLPPGTFRIDREGSWRHEGLEVTHPGVLQNLYANLRVDGDAHYLQVGPTRIPVEVEDAPFVVTRIEVREGSGAMLGTLWGHLSDGSAEPLALDSFWIGRRDAPYCRVKGERFTARLAVPAWLQLVPFVREGPRPGEITLVVGEQHVVLRRR